MRIEQWDPADQDVVQACHEVMLAVHQVDEPVEPPLSPGAFGLFLRQGWDKTPGELWVAVDDSGAVLGYYRINLPDLENLNKASGGPQVHPAVRRRGIGRALLRHEAGRAAAHGRALLGAQVTTGSAGDAFARAIGARLDLEEVRRVQYLSKLPPGVVASLRAAAERAAAGYSVVSWSGVIPEEYQGPVAQVINAFADAPHGANEEPEIWDAERVRERTGSPVRAGLYRGYGVGAVHDETGEMAAYTEVVIDVAAPQWAFQQLTAVTRPHRGHRLGLLVKTAMLELLATAEPQLEWIQTGNAASNRYMISVNDQLGYEVVEPGWRHYEIPVAGTR